MATQYILSDQIDLLRKSLTENPAQVTKVDEDGRTPLFWAVSQNKPLMIRLILDAKKNDLAIVDNAGWTVLHVAAAVGNEEVVAQLLEAPINAKTNGGQTALQLAVSKNHLEVVNTLIKAGANVKTKDNQGHSALQRAASIGSTKLVTTLLDAGAAINATDSNGWTALFDAIAEGHDEIITLLVSRGAHTDIIDKEDRPLLAAAPNLDFARHAEELIKTTKQK